jgi:hypothetical protein
MHDQDKILSTLQDEYIVLVDHTALVCGVIKYKPMHHILKESTVVLAPKVQDLWKGTEPKARRSWMELKQMIDDMTPNDDDFNAAKYICKVLKSKEYKERKDSKKARGLLEDKTKLKTDSEKGNSKATEGNRDDSGEPGKKWNQEKK